MSNAIGVIRPFTDEDQQALDRAARKFATRHRLRLPADSPDPLWQELQTEVEHARLTGMPWLARYWQACFCRALGQPVSAAITVAYGCVGYRCSG